MTEYTPLACLPPELCALQLPEYFDAHPLSERIGIPVRRLGRLAAIGHFNGFRITAYRGESVHETPGIAAMDSTGAATADVGVSVAAELSKVMLKENAKDNEFHTRPVAELAINMAVVEERAQRRGPVRDPHSWVQPLSQALGDAMRKTTWAHLTRRLPPGSDRLSLIAVALAGPAEIASWLSDTAPLPLDEFVPLAVIAPELVNIIATTLIAMLSGTRNKDVCWSLVPGWHVDRAGLVSGLSRATRLAKVL